MLLHIVETVFPSAMDFHRCFYLSISMLDRKPVLPYDRWYFLQAHFSACWQRQVRPAEDIARRIQRFSMLRRELRVLDEMLDAADVKDVACERQSGLLCP